MQPPKSSNGFAGYSVSGEKGKARAEAVVAIKRGSCCSIRGGVLRVLAWRGVAWRGAVWLAFIGSW
eukprot:2103255-Rhodomonas_salina.1